MTINLELTTEQAQAILGLADAAVRSNGLQLARQAVILMDLIDSAVNEAQETQKNKDDQLP